MGLMRRYEAYDSFTAAEEGIIIDGLKYLNERLEEAGVEGTAVITMDANGDVSAIIRKNQRTELSIILENDWDRKTIEYSHDFSDCIGITKKDVEG